MGKHIRRDTMKRRNTMKRINTMKRKKRFKKHSKKRKYTKRKLSKKSKFNIKKVNNQYAGVRPPSKFTRTQRIAADEETHKLNISNLILNGEEEVATKSGKFIILNNAPDELRFIDISVLVGSDNELGHVSMLDQDDFDAYYRFDKLRDHMAEAVDSNDIVMMAGWIKFDHEGKIEKWNAHSGHYHPEEKDIEYTISQTSMPINKKVNDFAPILF